MLHLLANCWVYASAHRDDAVAGGVVDADAGAAPGQRRHACGLRNDRGAHLHSHPNSVNAPPSVSKEDDCRRQILQSHNAHHLQA